MTLTKVMVWENTWFWISYEHYTYYDSDTTEINIFVELKRPIYDNLAQIFVQMTLTIDLEMTLTMVIV